MADRSAAGAPSYPRFKTRIHCWICGRGWWTTEKFLACVRHCQEERRDA